MSKIILIILTLYFVQSQSQSTCPTYSLRYEKNDTDRWYAVVNLQSETKRNGIWLKIKLDNTAHLLGNSFGDVISRNNKDFLIKNESVVLDVGEIKPVHFFVKYFSKKTPPRVVQIDINGCKGHKIEGDEDELYIPPISPVKPSRKEPADIISIEDKNGASEKELLDLFSVIFTEAPPERLEPILINDVECGKPAAVALPFIVGGRETEHVKWPWHAALYHGSDHSADPGYQCGGSLITKQHILTVAHCLTKRDEFGNIRKINPELLLVVLGQIYLGEYGSTSQQKSIVNTIIHGGYNKEFSNDIGIAKMVEPIIVTPHVRPVCLCDKSDETFEGRIGTVVGWGRWSESPKKKTSTNLRETKMLVRNVYECLDDKRIRQILTASMFCAGYRNGSAVCQGDSGGGMVFPKKDKSGSSEIWEIGGLASVGFPSANFVGCGAQEYAIFTNVAKHLNWIRSSLQYL
ncbi:hypothetical protein HHI36_021369 [Cryptolaemus montrouzieri]|uniref:Peptidase S1 domain-containing protein n=1 Tax=Cryptolaemus montrouzieri TaxID=559131 RepID=A0ABD2MXI3_9CUCU